MDESDKLSDELSIKLAETYGVDKYYVVCDIVKSRIPGTVHVDRKEETGEATEFKSISKIIGNIEKEVRIKIYVNDEIKKKLERDINKVLEKMICNWGA